MHVGRRDPATRPACGGYAASYEQTGRVVTLQAIECFLIEVDVGWTRANVDRLEDESDEIINVAQNHAIDRRWLPSEDIGRGGLSVSSHGIAHVAPPRGFIWIPKIFKLVDVSDDSFEFRERTLSIRCPKLIPDLREVVKMILQLHSRQLVAQGTLQEHFDRMVE